MGGGGWVAPIFWGSSKFLGGAVSGSRGVPSNFWGGGSNFLGGLVPGVLQIFGGVSSPEYGQRSAGTHPTGMHSCTIHRFVLKTNFIFQQVSRLAYEHTSLSFTILWSFLSFITQNCNISRSQCLFKAPALKGCQGEFDIFPKRCHYG